MRSVVVPPRSKAKSRAKGSRVIPSVQESTIVTGAGERALKAPEDDNVRLKFEAALRKSEERLRQVVESAPNAIVMIAATGVIEMVNAQTERMFGYPRNELLGQPIELLVPERYRRNHPHLRTSFFKRPVSRWLGAGRDLFGLRKDASEFPVEIGLNPIETDEGTMVLAAVVDISARKRLEERLHQVVESSPNAIVMIAATGLIDMVNAQTERMFGYPRNELLGQPIEMLVPERYHRNHPYLRASFYERPISRPMGAGRDLFGRRKDGSEFPVEIGLNPIEIDEGTMVLAAVADISERKQKDERLRAALSKLAHMDRVATAGELSVSIAHEIMQPLTAMVSNANAAVRWLTNNPPDLNRVRKCLDAVASGGLRAGEVVSSVRTMFKRDSGEQSQVDLNEVIQDVLEVLREELERLEIIVQTELTTPPPLVLGHYGQLQQVILNLVKNSTDAMKSLPDGRRMLRVSSTVRDHPDVVHMSVEDSGGGIDPKNIERIFDPFFSTKSQGMGVGLSICRRIIEDHRGRIWSSPGFDHGAIFHVELPVFRGRVE